MDRRRQEEELNKIRRLGYATSDGENDSWNHRNRGTRVGLHGSSRGGSSSDCGRIFAKYEAAYEILA
jgi:hypothetical protein